MRSFTKQRITTLALCTLLSLGAEAAPITDLAGYSAIGGTLVDFNSTLTGYYNALVIGGVTITASTANGLMIYDDQYEHLGISSSTPPADNAARNADPLALTFTFTNLISRMAFQYGNSTITHFITAYDSAGVRIEQVAFGQPGPTDGGYLDGFAGIDVGINQIRTVIMTGLVSASINFDDLRYAALAAVTQTPSTQPITPNAITVPEPGSLALGGLGLAALIGTSRRRRR